MLTCDDNDFKTWAETQCFYPEAEDEDLDNVNTEGWKKRMTQFGGPITKPLKIQDPTVDPSTEKLIDNPDLGKFQYGDEPTYWIGRLDTFLDTPALLPNVDIHIQLDLSKPEYVFQSLDDKNTDINYCCYVGDTICTKIHWWAISWAIVSNLQRKHFFAL